MSESVVPQVGSDPVFIVGAARSGTTLLQQMLDHHSAFAFPWESHFIPEFHRNQDGFGDLQKKENRLELIHAIAEYADMVYREREGEEWIPGLAAAAPQLAEKSPASFQGVIDTMYKFFAENSKKPRWGDKTPGYVDSMPLIAELFPRAKFIHIIRDGRDVAASIIPLSFGPNTAFLAARKWEKCVRHGLGFAEQYPDKVFTIKYEDLIDDPEKHLRAICEFLNEPFEPEMLDFHKDGLERVRLRRGSQVIHTNIAKPPNKSASGRWKRDLSADDVRVFEAVAGKMLERLGYERSQPNAKVGTMDKLRSRIKHRILSLRPNTRPSPLAERIAIFWQRKTFRWERARW